MEQVAAAGGYGDSLPPPEPEDQVSFRSIDGYPYKIDEWGDVWSIPCVVMRSNGRPYTVVPKRIKPIWNGGHWQVELAGKAFYVHVLVLETFEGSRPTPEHKGLHRDDDPHHNHISNLYWGTMSDNAFDRVRNGNDPNARKVRCKRGHQLAGANLAPWTKAGRCCLSCNRAKGVARHQGRAHDEAYVQRLADEKYALLGGDAL
jgi:hypothetical protein